MRPAPGATRLFGYVVYLGFVRPDWPRMVAFVLLSLAVGVSFVGFGVLAGSLSFFIGNARALADQWRNTVISFSTYPPTLFRGTVKILLYTVIPAGFISYLPVEALRSIVADCTPCSALEEH